MAYIKKTILRLIHLISKVNNYFYYSLFEFYDGVTSRSNKLRFGRGCEFLNPKLIKFGRNVSIGNNSTIKAITSFKSNAISQTFEPIIKIGSNVQVTGQLQIHSMIGITIEDDVLIATNVFISDGFHGYKDANTPYKDQEIIKLEKITIGKGSWIGQNVVIMPGVTIGEYSVIGANSVVTKNIPQKSIAVGMPCRIIKKWDDERNTWINS